jgi:hypothetical protein
MIVNVSSGRGGPRNWAIGAGAPPHQELRRLRQHALNMVDGTRRGGAEAPSGRSDRRRFFLLHKM